MMKASEIEQKIKQLADPSKVKILSSFFKTGKGEYGEGDQFIGVTVPMQRALVKSIKTLELSEIQKLLKNPIHECRMTALLFLVEKFKKEKNEEAKAEIYKFYITNYPYINNWDLVDLSAPIIVGGFLLNRPKDDLYIFAKSTNLWLQRIAIVSTLTFIRNGQFDDTLSIAELLLHHRHDLIHKAVGWMLREVGKRDFNCEYAFFTQNGRYKTMPRTMLRYAIEKFPEEMRKNFLVGKI